MAKKQGSKCGLTNTDRLAVAAFSALYSKSITERTCELAASPAFHAFADQFLREIMAADDRDIQEGELLTCLAVFESAMHATAQC